MFKNWSNRDWYWLLSYFLFIIILLLANYYLEWETNLSIITDATSLALAIIAIFLSFKQDSDNRITTDSIRGGIEELRREGIKQQDLDRLFDKVGQQVEDSKVVEEISPEKTEDNYTLEDLKNYGEKVKRETIEAYKGKLNKEVENFNSYRSSLNRKKGSHYWYNSPYRYIKPKTTNSKLFTEEEVEKLFKLYNENKNIKKDDKNENS